MAKKSDSDKSSAFHSLDLSQLKDLSFGPDWASERGKKRAEESYRDHDGSDRRASRGGRRSEGRGRDRRGDMNRRQDGDSGRRREGNFRRGDDDARSSRPPFEPTVDVIFVSQDKPFEVLLKAMRTTHKTYELFEIARIVLGKENRFVAILSPKADAAENKLFVSVPDQIPFQTREEAINHVMSNHLERWFSIEEIEVDPPSGNFQMVNRCKLTGELLAPPNFHRYQDILKEHFAKNIHNLPWERFLERIESVKEPEVVQEWLDKMKKTFRYTLKQKEGDESPKVVLNALEDVRYYLTTERKNEVFSAKDKVRLPGEKIELLPRGDLRRSIERELEYQRRFPLVTSNHLRGRLRRCNLNFFKKGSKGVTFVCAIKRKPRYKDTVFSESIQALIDFVTAHPKISVEDLLQQYQPAGVESMTEETQKAVLQDLRWLVGAGYVTEYGDSTLYADKPLDMLAAEDPNHKPEAPKSKRKGKSGDAKAAATQVSASVEGESNATAVDAGSSGSETSTPEESESALPEAPTQAQAAEHAPAKPESDDSATNASDNADSAEPAAPSTEKPEDAVAVTDEATQEPEADDVATAEKTDTSSDETESNAPESTSEAESDDNAGEQPETSLESSEEAPASEEEADPKSSS